MPAWLPEQFIATRLGPSPARTTSFAAARDDDRGEDGPHRGDVLGLALVAGGHDRQPRRVQHDARAERGDRLEGLERAARVDGGVDVAVPREDRAVRRDHDGGADVLGLREPGALDDGEGNGSRGVQCVHAGSGMLTRGRGR
jgi:hypothetical protein